jgi:branched-chain amino acid transport system substrate-binding protein
MAAQLSERSAHLRKIPDEGKAERQGRRALPERRFRQGLPQGPEGRLRRQGGSRSIAEESYEISEPTIDNHIVKLKAAAPDVLISITTPKFAAQTIKKMAEIDWKALQIVANVSTSVGAVMKPAVSRTGKACCRRTTPRTPAMRNGKTIPDEEVSRFLDKYYPDADRSTAR